MALVGLAAFLGHLYPVFFKFKGGKGVATALGVLLGLSAWLGLATVAVFLVVVVAARYVSLASVVAALMAPVIYVMADGGLWFSTKSVALAVSVMALLLLYRHTENINRLIKGTESKLGKKPQAAPLPVPQHHHGHGHSHKSGHKSSHSAGHTP